MDAYHILERIGEGSFGKVYRGRRKYSGHIVALKFVTKRGKNAKELQSLRDEVVPRVCICLHIHTHDSVADCAAAWLARTRRSASCDA